MRDAVLETRKRRKAGEGLLEQAQRREEYLRRELTRVEERKVIARNRLTGKTRAIAAVKGWLDRLSTMELRAELHRVGFELEEMDSIDQAVSVILTKMFYFQHGDDPAVHDVAE